MGRCILDQDARQPLAATVDNDQRSSQRRGPGRRQHWAAGGAPADNGNHEPGKRHILVTSAAFIPLLVASITIMATPIGVGHRHLKVNYQVIYYGFLTIPLQFSDFLIFPRQSA